MPDHCLICHRPLSPLRLGALCQSCALDAETELRSLAALPPRERAVLAGVLRVAGLLLLARVCEHE